MSSHIYLLHGEEGVLITEQLNQLKQQFDIDNLNMELLEGAETDVSQISQALQSTPMLFSQGKKLVIIRDLPYLKAGKDSSVNQSPITNHQSPVASPKGSKDDEVEQIVRLLETVSEDTIVIFTFLENSNWKNPRKVDKRKKLYKTLKKLGTILEFNRFADWETQKCANWIQDRVSLEGKDISPEAVYALSEVSGSRLGVLSTEIKKLVTYIGDNSRIEASDVATLTSEGQSAGFALVNALRDRDSVSALKALKQMVRYGENEVGLLMRIVNQFRTLLQIKSLQEEKKSPGEITQMIGGHQYAIKLLLSAAGKFTLSELKQVLHILAEADYRLKTGQMAKDVLLEMIIIDICKGVKDSVLLESVVD